MLPVIPFNVEHLSCCLRVLFVFHSYDSRQKLPVSNCTPQMSKIKQWMLTHGQDKGLSSESCKLHIWSPGLDCDRHTEERVLMYTFVPSLRGHLDIFSSSSRWFCFDRETIFQHDINA